jgi:hypothetical protein
LRTHFRVPKVYVSHFVQTHVRVHRSGGVMQVELWEHPRPSPPRLRVAEWIAVIGRLPEQPEAGAAPRIRETVTLR